MKNYSEYEFSLIQLQQSENIQSAKLAIHPLIEEYCSTHEDWLPFYDEFKEKSITNSVLKEIYNSFYDWVIGIRKILQHDVDLFEAESCMTEHALWENKNAALSERV
ncbi:hypothetical protein MXB_4462 [Myxobolus squamalis]|nr:hypothetical protein MXB_4462 [Myxobolus squamalis]